MIYPRFQAKVPILSTLWDWVKVDDFTLHFWQIVPKWIVNFFKGFLKGVMKTAGKNATVDVDQVENSRIVNVDREKWVIQCFSSRPF